ncbi:hypothetical protein BC829DRAFT_148373 [Chytridium lagenaria]|nr:hypothetical protein BC829DRAFT_148373 [Chytridium lagenaria]
MTDCQAVREAVTPLLGNLNIDIPSDGTSCCSSASVYHYIRCSSASPARVESILLNSTGSIFPSTPFSPAFGRLSALTDLVIVNTSLTGDLPDAFDDLPNLRILDLSVNGLTGNLPKSISRLSSLLDIVKSLLQQVQGINPVRMVCVISLQTMNLSRNELSGSLPESWNGWTAANLTSLSFSNNSLVGEIDVLSSFKRLEILDLQHNLFLGLITPTYSSLPRMKEFLITNNKLTGNIPQSLSSWKDNNPSMLLAYNAFYGTLPQFMFTLRNL